MYATFSNYRKNIDALFDSIAREAELETRPEGYSLYNLLEAIQKSPKHKGKKVILILAEIDSIYQRTELDERYDYNFLSSLNAFNDHEKGLFLIICSEKSIYGTTGTNGGSFAPKGQQKFETLTRKELKDELQREIRATF